MGPTEHRHREIQAEDPASPSVKTHGHDARTYSNLDYRSIAERKMRVHVSGVLVTSLLASAGCVVVLGNMIEFSHL
jgi:hypothetical protein